MLFRKETRWPGYYFRADAPKIDEDKWHVFANCRCEAETGKWEMLTRQILHVFEQKTVELALAAVPTL